ncbi:hypothetical protein EVAR_76628_1 [Eumeta japonica]|uniref:Uncharacterized protein n=1 Tax=Eumeta variegata TaxID=151549 RepID=A0A4C1T696_EUMVA|nr:hypothetical protein EVAR_76628_1 [Eumeta japonica]
MHFAQLYNVWIGGANPAYPAMAFSVHPPETLFDCTANVACAVTAAGLGPFTDPARRTPGRGGAGGQRQR